MKLSNETDKKNSGLDKGKPIVTYQITVQGQLDQDWQVWFNSLFEAVRPSEDQPPVTKLIVSIADQAALRGILNKLWDLNLVLISLDLIEVEGRDKEESND